MLITQLKSKDTIQSLTGGKKVFIINCFGCREVYFPLEEAETIQSELFAKGSLTGILTTDYICNPANLEERLKGFQSELETADAVLVFSCGVGVQTVSSFLMGAPSLEGHAVLVYAGCDTCRLPGFQGVTPTEYDCGQCGECYLNLTGGICPITACSKSLVNGQCGGSKNGKCEVDPDMECGWERIYRRLEKIGRLDAMKGPTQIRNFATDTDL